MKLTAEQVKTAEKIFASLVSNPILRNYDWHNPPTSARETLVNLAHFAEFAAKLFHDHLAEGDVNLTVAQSTETGDKHE